MHPLLPVKRAGWEVSFDAYGVPFEWTPLGKADLAGYRRDEVRIVESNPEILKECKCKDLVKGRSSKLTPDSDLQRALQLLFGLKR